jgi:peroxiredoxin
MAKLDIGDRWLDFDLPGVDGERYSLSQFEDQEAVAVIFSCNHCPYVQAWEDRMVGIQAEYAEKGVQLVAINPNDAKKYPSDSFEKMKERAAERGFNFPYLWDESQQVARRYGAERTPEIFLFDRSHRLRYHGPIDDNYDDPEAVREHYLRQALEAVLEGENPPTEEVPPVGCTIKWK